MTVLVATGTTNSAGNVTLDAGSISPVYVQIGKNFKVRHIQIGERNDDDVVVTGGLKEGEIVTLESPADAAKRAKKKL